LQQPVYRLFVSNTTTKLTNTTGVSNNRLDTIMVGGLAASSTVQINQMQLLGALGLPPLGHGYWIIPINSLAVVITLGKSYAVSIQ
ncbi:MAG: hypothetical protein N2C12_13585, partial [Planctomycetales bacterium]